MIKRTTKIVTFLLLIVGVAIVVAKASPRAYHLEMRVQRERAQSSVDNKRFAVTGRRDLSDVGQRRERVGALKVSRLVDAVDMSVVRSAVLRRAVEVRLNRVVDEVKERGLFGRASVKEVSLREPVAVYEVGVLRQLDNGVDVSEVVTVSRDVEGRVALVRGEVTVDRQEQTVVYSV
jgi:hypothetical protein